MTHRTHSTDAFRTWWSRQRDSHHTKRADVDVHAIAAGEISLLAGPTDVRRILDLCCGAGEVFDHLGLAADGYLGVDYSAEMIAAFRDRHPELDLEVWDASTFRTSRQFDLIMVNFALQYLDPAAVRRLLRNARGMLSPGGRLVLTSVPRRSLRPMYIEGGAAAEPRPPSPVQRLRGLDARIRRRRRDDLGNWYEPGEVAAWARQEGLRASAFGSLVYPYRFSLVLTGDG